MRVVSVGGEARVGPAAGFAMRQDPVGVQRPVARIVPLL